MNAGLALLNAGLLFFLGLVHLRLARTGATPNSVQKRMLPSLLWLLVMLIPYTFGILAPSRLWALLLLFVLVTQLAPEHVLLKVAWRFGMPTMAGFIASFTLGVFQSDRRGGEVLAQARALLRRRPARYEADALLERLTALKPLRGAGIAAQGLLLARRGDLQGARALLHSVRWLDARVCPTLALSLSLEWLAADAAERGAWREVLELTAEPASRSPGSELLRAFALRVLGTEAVAPRLLWRRWILAGCPASALPMLRRLASETYTPPSELAPPPPVAASAPGAEESAPEASLERTLALHAACVSAGRVSAHALDTLASAWEATLATAAFARTFEQRGAALGVSDLVAVRRAFEAEVHEDLLALAQRSRVTSDALRGQGPVLKALRDALPRMQLAEVEALCDAIRARVDARRALPGVDEWREFVALRAAHQRVLDTGNAESRRLAFPRVHNDLCALAVWLSNQRTEHAISHAMFTWLLREAEAVGDERAVELQRKNSKFGPL